MNSTESTHSAPSGTGMKPRGSFVRSVFRKIFILTVISIVGFIVLSITAVRPNHLGVKNGKLAPVPDSPNCVSSMTEKADFLMDAISTAGVNQPMEKLRSVIASNFSRTKLISDDGGYLHYEFTSLVFRFTDDVEFLLDETGQKIHFRSASRVGYSDLGANRKRMQRVRAAFEK